MTGGAGPRKPPHDTLRLLAETVMADAALLRITDGRLLALLGSAAEWIECRQLRNLMIHEDVRDRTVCAATLSKGHLAVPLRAASAHNLADQVLSSGARASMPDVG